MKDFQLAHNGLQKQVEGQEQSMEEQEKTFEESNRQISWLLGLSRGDEDRRLHLEGMCTRS